MGGKTKSEKFGHKFNVKSYLPFSLNCMPVNGKAKGLDEILLTDLNILVAMIKVSKTKKIFYRELFSAFAVGSLVDLDHLLVARPFFSLNGALHLHSRPYGHCLLFPILLVVSYNYVLYN